VASAVLIAFAVAPLAARQGSTLKDDAQENMRKDDARPTWHNADLPYGGVRVDECPARIALSVPELLQPERMERRTANAGRVRCNGAYVELLELKRSRGVGSPLVLHPWVRLRPGRDMLALITFELWQGDRRIGIEETAVPLDEGGANWEDPVRLHATPATGGPVPVLRIVMTIEDE
jgi:hypothetical protein